jgi:hypothetical protein
VNLKRAASLIEMSAEQTPGTECRSARIAVKREPVSGEPSGLSKIFTDLLDDFVKSPEIAPDVIAALSPTLFRRAGWNPALPAVACKPDAAHDRRYASPAGITPWD